MKEATRPGHVRELWGWTRGRRSNAMYSMRGTAVKSHNRMSASTNCNHAQVPRTTCRVRFRRSDPKLRAPCAFRRFARISVEMEGSSLWILSTWHPPIPSCHAAPDNRFGARPMHQASLCCRGSTVLDWPCTRLRDKELAKKKKTFQCLRVFEICRKRTPRLPKIRQTMEKATPRLPRLTLSPSPRAIHLQDSLANCIICTRNLST
jgi:hypothetical protein